MQRFWQIFQWGLHFAERTKSYAVIHVSLQSNFRGKEMLNGERKNEENVGICLEYETGVEPAQKCLFCMSNIVSGIQQTRK